MAAAVWARRRDNRIPSSETIRPTRGMSVLRGWDVGLAAGIVGAERRSRHPARSAHAALTVRPRSVITIVVFPAERKVSHATGSPHPRVAAPALDPDRRRPRRDR